MGTLICAKCRAIPVDGVCPLCGKNKKFIEAGDNDEVYLTSCEYIWSRMVEDALDGAGIRYRRHGTRGSGVIASIGEACGALPVLCHVPGLRGGTRGCSGHRLRGDERGRAA